MTVKELHHQAMELAEKANKLRDAGDLVEARAVYAQAADREFTAARASGLSYQRIGEQLFKEGAPPRNGGPWSSRSIYNLVEGK